MSSETVKVTGIAELVAQLKAFPPLVVQDAERKSMRKAANVFRDEAKARVPRRTGKLEGSIRVRAGGKKSKYLRISVVARAPHAHLVEYGYMLTGHKPNLTPIRPIAPRPFMRPAFEARKGEVFEIIRAELEKQVARLNRKAGK